MPRTGKKPSNAQRGSDGMFVSNHKLPPSPDSGSKDSDSDDEMAWESATDVEPEDSSYSEAWQKLPLPMTFDEQAEERAAQRKRAEEKRWIAEMRGVEQGEAGAPDNQKGKTCMYGDDGNDTDEEDDRPVDCCMRRLLLTQSDFAQQKTQLELLIEAAPGMYASVYQLGATGPVAEFAVKKYRSHRGVLKTELEEVKLQWDKKARSCRL
ncbi:hypothetical protein B0H10DRAFT_2233941 [Mycena sp. CBHHK59/15]|nr:hypothetical protein B0H10DRAFT_2233941 [Mycena sp. CBHHK59/15]